MESMDKVSIVVQMLWMMMMLLLMYVVVLKYMMPRMKKMLEMSKYLYENNILSLYNFKMMEESMSWNNNSVMCKEMGMLEDVNELLEMNKKYWVKEFVSNLLYKESSMKNGFLMKKFSVK